MPKGIQRVAILVGAIVVGLAALTILLKGAFLLLRLALLALVIGAGVLVFRAVARAWKKSRCEACGAFLTVTDHGVAMSGERLRALVDTGNAEAVFALLTPATEDTDKETHARVRACARCGGTRWLTVHDANGELLLEQRMAPRS